MKNQSHTNDRLRKIVESFPNVTVTVVGDLVADEFVFGERFIQALEEGFGEAVLPNFQDRVQPLSAGFQIETK